MKKHTKFLLFCFVLILSLLNLKIVNSADLEIDDQIIMEEDVVSFTVSINNAPNDLNDIQFDIQFDGSVLSFNDEFVKGELVTNFTSFDVNEISEGVLRVEGISTQPVPAGSTGVLVNIKFTVNACKQTSLELVNLVIDLQGLSTKNGTLTCNETEEQMLSADFDVSITEGVAPLNLQFTDKSESETDIFFWAWDFGDGNSSIEQNPVHTYQTAGIFSVTLTVFASANPDDLNSPAFKAMATKRDIINVKSNEIPEKANLEVTFRPNPVPKVNTENDKWLYTVDIAETTGIGVTITGFKVINENSDILTDEDTDIFVAWFNDCSTPSKGFIPGFGFACGNVVSTEPESGLNRIWSFSGIDENGNDITASGKVILSTSALPIADFSATPTVGKVPLTVKFTDKSKSSTDIFLWVWNFGDGQTSNDQNPIHTYTFPGRYHVSLTISVLSTESDPNSVVLSNTKSLSNFIFVQPVFRRGKR